MLKQVIYKILILSLSFCLLAKFVTAADDAQPKITFTKINDNFWILHGGNGLGANAGLSIGDDGLVLIDAMNTDKGKELIAAIRTISDKPIKYVINTHQHRDHRGGNEALVALGATVVYPNFLKYQVDEYTAYQGVEREIQFNDRLSLKLNDEIFDLYHVKSHTWNDVIVHLRNNNAVFTGDNHGTSWGPNIGALGIKSHRQVFDLVLSLANEQTLIVPGHTKLADLKHVIDYDNKTMEWFDLIWTQVERGETAGQIVKSEKITKLLSWFHGGQLPTWITEDRLLARVEATISADQGKTIKLNLVQQAKYIGSYELEDGGLVEIFNDKGELFAFKDKSFMVHLLPRSKKHFDFSGWDKKEHFEFELDKSGTPQKLKFLAGNKSEFLAKKSKR